MRKKLLALMGLLATVLLASCANGEQPREPVYAPEVTSSTSSTTLEESSSATDTSSSEDSSTSDIVAKGQTCRDDSIFVSRGVSTCTEMIQLATAALNEKANQGGGSFTEQIGEFECYAERPSEGFRDGVFFQAACESDVHEIYIHETGYYEHFIGAAGLSYASSSEFQRGVRPQIRSGNHAAQFSAGHAQCLIYRSINLGAEHGSVNCTGVFANDRAPRIPEYPGNPAANAITMDPLGDAKPTMLQGALFADGDSKELAPGTFMYYSSVLCGTHPDTGYSGCWSTQTGRGFTVEQGAFDNYRGELTLV